MHTRPKNKWNKFFFILSVILIIGSSLACSLTRDNSDSQEITGTGKLFTFKDTADLPEYPSRELVLRTHRYSEYVSITSPDTSGGFGSLLGTIDRSKKTVSITDYDGYTDICRGTVNYASGSLVGEVDCNYPDNGDFQGLGNTPWIKIIMP